MTTSHAALCLLLDLIAEEVTARAIDAAAGALTAAGLDDEAVNTLAEHDVWPVLKTSVQAIVLDRLAELDAMAPEPMGAA